MIRTKEKHGKENKKRGASCSKKSVGKGTAKLSKMADGEVLRSSDQIARSLLTNALRGNVNSTRLLLSLAEGVGDGEGSGTAQLKVSLAKAWAAEPEWLGEIGESTAEIAIGSREPEN